MTFRSLLGHAFAVALLSTTTLACGDDVGGVAPPASSTMTIHTSRTTTSGPVATTTSTSRPTGSLSVEQLAQAEGTVTTFVDSLGRGDLDAAGAVIGPVSEQQAAAAGGVISLLQQSTEGYGAWIDSRDRVVGSVGLAPGLVVVVLEGTVHVEGHTQHRVDAIPVRQAESGAWLVEPWAHEIGRPVPLVLRSPQIDEQDLARVVSTESVVVRVETALQGTVWTVVDGGLPLGISVAMGERSTQFVVHAGQQAVIVFDAGSTIFATAFRLVDVDAPVPTTPTTTLHSSSVISVPLLSEEINQLLRSYAAGNDASCDATQTPGVLDADAFSYVRDRCSGEDQIYCRLFDHLLEAARRVHASER